MMMTVMTMMKNIELATHSVIFSTFYKQVLQVSSSQVTMMMVPVKLALTTCYNYFSLTCFSIVVNAFLGIFISYVRSHASQARSFGMILRILSIQLLFKIIVFL